MHFGQGCKIARVHCSEPTFEGRDSSRDLLTALRCGVRNVGDDLGGRERWGNGGVRNGDHPAPFSDSPTKKLGNRHGPLGVSAMEDIGREW